MTPPSAAKVRRLRWILSLSILLASILIAILLVHTRPKARVEPPREPELAVRLQTAVSTNLTVQLESFGIARPLREVDLAPEVAARIVAMPRVLKPGDRVEAGELLVVLEETDFQAAVDEAEAATARVQSALAQLDIQERSDLERTALLERTRDLARAEFERVDALHREEKIGTSTAVEGAEQAYNLALNNLLLLRQSLALLSERRNELRNEFRASEARLERARLQLARTRLHAPFAGRLTHTTAEVGALAQPGRPLLGLADDSALEIQAAITASDLRQWIPFEDARGLPGFAPLPPLPVSIEWSDGGATLAWQGRLHRVISLDATTRTATLAVRIEGDALRGEGPLPLADGMFCRILLPGNRLENVIALPRSAVTFDGNVFLSVEGRLRTLAVTPRRSEGESVYVSGIPEGARVVLTRVIAPLEGVKLIEAE